MTIKERNGGGHDSTIEYDDQNPEAVDKLPKSNLTHSFYFVKCRIYQNHELETKIYHAEEEIKNLDQTCKLIRGTILQKKPKYGYQRPWEWQSTTLEDDRYKKVINEKKTKIDYKRQAYIGELRARFDTSRIKGDDTCSSEKELNNRVCSLHFRTRCAKSTFVKEKQLLREIKQLEETRQENIINDALKQKRFNEAMEWVSRPSNPGRYTCESSRKEKKLEDMDLDKLKREKQVLTARVKNAEETQKKRTAVEKLLDKLKKQQSEEKLNYNRQYYNKYKSLLQNARKLAANKNIAALEELSHREVYVCGMRRIY
ncbi:hypothetical protein MKX01_000559 [Papaver californicum]|nr:hypothetical protein MKX01_017555 [Papaver californicum]KAI3990123.1 hypothetical protein MKX01_000559 [Papaver californicum]